MAEYRYADAARALYDFAWDEFCSFYVEMVKGRLAQTRAALTLTLSRKGEGTILARGPAVLAHTLDTLLRLLHPMIPFLTEDVWQRLAQVAPQRGIDKIQPAAESIMIAPWPEFDAKRQNADNRSPIRPIPAGIACDSRHPHAAERAAENAARIFGEMRRCHD